MESADNSKLNLADFDEAGGLEENMGSQEFSVAGGLEENMGSQKFSVMDHINGFQYTTEKSDSFVIDMEDFSHAIPSPRITLQRSLSRKGTQARGSSNEKRINLSTSPSNRDPAVVTSSSRGPRTPEKGTITTMVGTTDHSQVHHQITITTSNINSSTEGRCTTRRNSFKRHPPTWVLDPRRVLFFFATLSSMGTILLIYFTLTTGKISVTENALD